MIHVLHKNPNNYIVDIILYYIKGIKGGYWRIICCASFFIKYVNHATEQKYQIPILIIIFYSYVCKVENLYFESDEGIEGDKYHHITYFQYLWP